MPQFSWVGVDKSGSKRKGVREAPSKEALAAFLRSEEITPKRISKQLEIGQISIGSGVKPKELQVFTRMLATMIDAGLPLVQSVDILASQTENKIFAKVLYDVKASIETGDTFSSALGKHPKVFDELFVNLVNAGEIGGILDTILGRLAVYIEKAVKLKGQLKSAMIYPTSVLVVAIGVIAIMLGKVIPVFEKMYKEFGDAELPAPTQFVIKISHMLTDNWYFFIGGGILFFIGFILMLKYRSSRRQFHKFLLKVPVIGNVLRKIVVARFTRTLGTLLTSGVSILDALEICAKTSGNIIVEESIMYARDKVSEGKELAGPLEETNVFPSMVTQMIGIGEQTGAMDTMLQKVADFYEEEVDLAVAGLTALIEPIMMVFLGVVCGGLIIAMYLPIFEIAGTVTEGAQ